MTHVRKVLPVAAILALFATVAAFGLVPLDASGADHLDAPGLTSPGGDGRLDINDLFVFEGEHDANTVLAMTVNPVATGDSAFASFRDGSYHFRIDTDGDAVEDVAYSVSFLNRIFGDGQFVYVRRATGKAARDERPRGRIVGFAATDRERKLLRGQGKVFAGLRSDPFFFDLGGFLGTVEGQVDPDNPRMLNDGNESDFFAGLNTLGIVLEIPDDQLGENIGVWATTSRREGVRRSTQVDRMGRAAINTVVNSSGPIVGADSEAKNVYNAGIPSDDVDDFLGAEAADGRFTFSLDVGRGVFVSGSLADVGPERRYQLWLIGREGPHPAGVFVPDRAGVSSAVVEGVMAGLVLGVTEEPAGGSDQPTGDVLLAGEV